MSFTSVPGARSRLRLVDHEETYGRHILQRVAAEIPVSTCLDLGCAAGEDLEIVGAQHPQAQLIGVDYHLDNTAVLAAKGIRAVSVNLETQALPFEDGSIDLVIANQVLEHTKEIYWINHEIFRTLKVGGHLYLGVPNTLSLHNRLLGLAGVHPTTCKMISAHVRPFSKRDTIAYYETVGASFLSVCGFHGAQFYPFPRGIARRLSGAFPSLALSIFFVIRKTAPYDGEFLRWLDGVELSTNFYTGPATPSGPPSQPSQPSQCQGASP